VSSIIKTNQLQYRLCKCSAASISVFSNHRFLFTQLGEESQILVHEDPPPA
jgi:hypothetical protein